MTTETEDTALLTQIQVLKDGIAWRDRSMEAAEHSCRNRLLVIHSLEYQLEQARRTLAEMGTTLANLMLIHYPTESISRLDEPAPNSREHGVWARALDLLCGQGLASRVQGSEDSGRPVYRIGR